MAFFGVTMLGPSNPYETLKFDSCACISTADFMECYRKVATHGELIVNEENITALLSEALDGKSPLQEDIDLFKSYWEEGKVITQLEFGAGLEKYHAQASLKPTKEYSSFRHLRDDKLRHRRVKADPHEAMRGPATSNQVYGWGGRAVTRRAQQSRLEGNIFCHKPSFLSFYNEFVTCAEDGRDFVPGPTLRAVENGP